MLGVITTRSSRTQKTEDLPADGDVIKRGVWDKIRAKGENNTHEVVPRETSKSEDVQACAEQAWS